MATKKKADTEASIMVVLDRSGSMSSLRDSTIAGYNQFLTDQSALPGAKFSLSQFDGDSIDDLYIDKPVAEVKPLDHATYVPRGSTPLYDAVGRGIKALEARKPSGKVVFCVITDGAENASREYSQRAVLDLVEEKRKEGWEFVFMGAGIDAYSAGQDIGVPAANTYAFAATADSTDAAFRNLSRSTSGYRTGAMASTAMPDVDTADPSYVPPSSTSRPGYPGAGQSVRPGSAPRSVTKASPLPSQTLGPK